MPTYEYRCLSCQQIQSVFQSMREMFSPACLACGGFTERFISQAPRVLNFKQEAPPASSTETTHECGSACYLHRQQPPA